MQKLAEKYFENKDNEMKEGFNDYIKEAESEDEVVAAVNRHIARIMFGELPKFKYPDFEDSEILKKKDAEMYKHFQQRKAMQELKGEGNAVNAKQYKPSKLDALEEEYIQHRYDKADEKRERKGFAVVD